ncbi:alpha/beta hydrolase [Draconibacterium halophilum]|uniref:Alpha/beta hydrolase n=1 Tax=Draconibacterium halophilum TaxID=2706887 RepID=A0A6C0RD34_9BACT|nr:alpha/beta hydrolase [Draconibacterium halophilum]QIA07041.1 alpha/beta hydrolase [Draconibacterium halophilum]
MTDIAEFPQAINAAGVHATFANERYGDHERNTFDIWLADTDKPTPLVIYIHGGGFIGGDKSRYYDSEDWVRLLNAGISVASINYRYMSEPPYGILGSMNDSKRCLQYIRANAEKYNLDKNRIACSGGSAGAGTSLWLAFSADMTDAESNDPVLRESTKIKCAAAFSTQSTYDILRWPDLLGIPPYKTPEELLSVARVFGFKSAEGVDLFAQNEIRKELDFLAKMTKDAVPFFVFNHYEGGVPTNEDELNHHPLHAKALKDRANEVGAEAIVYAPAIGISDPSGKDVVEFFIEKLR